MKDNLYTRGVLTGPLDFSNAAYNDDAHPPTPPSDPSDPTQKTPGTCAPALDSFPLGEPLASVSVLVSPCESVPVPDAVLRLAELSVMADRILHLREEIRTRVEPLLADPLVSAEQLDDQLTLLKGEVNALSDYVYPAWLTARSAALRSNH